MSTRHSVLSRMDWLIHLYICSTCHMDNSQIIWNSILPYWWIDHGYRKSRGCNWKNLEKNAGFIDIEFYSMSSLSMLTSSNYLRTKGFVWSVRFYEKTFVFPFWSVVSLTPYTLATWGCSWNVSCSADFILQRGCFRLKSALWEVLLPIVPSLQTMFLPEEGTIISSGLQGHFYFKKDV